MPRKVLFTKEEIIKTALDLVREKGISGLSARSLGEALGASPQPIFGYFESMSEVCDAVINAAEALHKSFLEEEMKKGKYPPYKASGMAYIRFAKQEKELFKLLFMRDRKQEKVQMHHADSSLLDLICKQVGIDCAKAETFFLEMWVYVHGIATMIATDYLDWDEESTARSLTDVYTGLKTVYSQGGHEDDHA